MQDVFRPILPRSAKESLFHLVAHRTGRPKLVHNPQLVPIEDEFGSDKILVIRGMCHLSKCLALPHFGYWWRSQNMPLRCLLHEQLKGRNTGLGRDVSSEPACELHDIDRRGDRYMPQVGFAQADIA